MDVLLVGVFGFFGLHTTLWFARSLHQVRARRARAACEQEEPDESTPQLIVQARRVLRFDRYQRITHGCLMVSFLGLAGTGMPLLFSDQRWAWWLSRFWGGFEAAAPLHRIFAVVMIATFVAHVSAHRPAGLRPEGLRGALGTELDGAAAA